MFPPASPQPVQNAFGDDFTAAPWYPPRRDLFSITEAIAPPTMNLSPVLNVTSKIVRQAGITARELFEHRNQLQVLKKAGNDLVTDADTRVEQQILAALRKSFPEDGILAEESGGKRRTTGRYWIVDPIDGTTNFIHGIPYFALSIALAEQDHLLAGVVYNPITDELFAAERGRGAFLNSHRIRATGNASMERALLATGFPHNNKENLARYLDSFREIFTACRGVRRQGSAALDLCHTAAGRYDGFWETGLSPWDIAAGALILQEAGGLITDLSGKGNFLTSGEVVAGGPKIQRQLLRRLQITNLYQKRTKPDQE